MKPFAPWNQSNRARPPQAGTAWKQKPEAAQHPLPDRPVLLRAALTGKTGLPGASSMTQGARPAQRSS